MDAESRWPILGKTKFDSLTRFLEGLSHLKPKDKTIYAEQYFKKVFLPTPAHRKESFLLLRLLCPSLDRERGNYGLKEVNLAKLLGEALGLNKIDANRLVHYKNPAYHPKDNNCVGDFVLVMRSVVAPFCKQESTMTLDEVDTFLDKLANTPEDQSKKSIFIQLLNRCSGRDLEWLCRIILKDLKIGMKEDKILRIYHPGAAEQFNYTFCLRDVCSEFAEKPVELEEEKQGEGRKRKTNGFDEGTSAQESSSLTLFAPVRPQLAARKHERDVAAVFSGDPFLIETKFDGERLQVHIDEERVKLYSRNCHDVTETYNSVISELREGLRGCKAGIFDGELCVVDKATKKRQPFGKNKVVARGGREAEGLHLCCKVV